MTIMPGPAKSVDTHVHVFERRLPMVAGRRYQPDYDAVPVQLLQQMKSAGIKRAVLVQPSFLGTDNHYLLEEIAKDPQSFAGIAVIDPDMARGDIAALKEAGIVGVRLNCIGMPTPDLARGAHREMAEHLAEAGLVLQIQAEGRQWLSIAPVLDVLPCSVLVDHFGRTPPGDSSGGFESLLSAAKTSANIWFKFSGPYRFTDGAADVCAAAIVEAIGTDRIVWGSDWPWTQFEQHHSYAQTLAWLDTWVSDASVRQKILADNPARLFGFDLQQEATEGFQHER